MIIDDRLEFADATALNTGGAASYLIGDVIDLKSPTIAPNTLTDLEGGDIYCVIQMDTSAGSGGSATGQFHLVSDDTASIATNGSATYHFSTAAIPFATLVAGYLIACFKLPRGNYERYLGILQTTGTAAFNAGKVNAFLVSDPALWRAYADNVA